MLFGLSHVWMGLFAVVLLPFCWSPRVWSFSDYIFPLLGTAGFYLTGQICLFQAIKWTDASRVSPLLGLKILVLAFVVVSFLSQRVTAVQWAAVFLSVVAALALNYSGGAVPWKAVAAILCACLFYSLSDLSIIRLVRALAPAGDFKGRLLSCCLCYVITAPVGVVMVTGGAGEDRTKEKWKYALPVAATWFTAMVFIFICFSAVGAVFGNIIQSMRGPISILIGVVIARLGHVHLERKVSKRVLLRRIVAAALMCVAVGLFAREQARLLRVPQRLERPILGAKDGVRTPVDKPAIAP